MKKIITFLLILVVSTTLMAAEKTGKFEIICPINSQVFFDGGFLLTTTMDSELVALGEIPIGEHTIKVIKDSVDLVKVTFLMHPDQIFTIDLIKKYDENLPDADAQLNPDVMPEAIKIYEPYYPPALKEQKLTGTVWVKVLVNKDGKVVKSFFTESSGHLSFDRAAMKAAYLNKYKPALKNGQPIACWVTYKVEFKLDEVVIE